MEKEHYIWKGKIYFFQRRTKPENKNVEYIWRRKICFLQRRRLTVEKKDSTVGGARAWAVLLAKTSRRVVPTAIMPIIAGGRLYKCLYKMHVDSRAFWGAFWGAFRVFLIDMG